MPNLIDKDAAYTALKQKEEEYGLSFSAEAFGKAARIIDQMYPVESIDRAEILRLCNEIEDAVTRIYNSDEEIMYNDLISIRDKLQAIGKELTGDAVN